MEENNALLLAQAIEHTLLKPFTSISDVQGLCQEALDHRFAGVCIPPFLVKPAMEILAGRPQKVVTVIGFPFGYHTLEVKKTEAQIAIRHGADEIDMVLNLSAFRSGKWDVLRLELEHMAVLCRARHTPLKVIIETGMLNDEELEFACELCAEAGPDYVKTSTGIGFEGAQPGIVQKMRQLLPPEIKIKASGGIKTTQAALTLIMAGADRLGTSSGLAIMKGL